MIKNGYNFHLYTANKMRSRNYTVYKRKTYINSVFDGSWCSEWDLLI